MNYSRNSYNSASGNITDSQDTYVIVVSKWSEINYKRLLFTNICYLLDADLLPAIF